jgi:type I site-specific restriction-modification system R (restriction) subunit
LARKHDLPEEAEIRQQFRQLREELKKKIKDFDDSELKTDDISSAIQYQYGLLARMEAELDKVPEDEQLELELENYVEVDMENPAFTRIPTATYNKLTNKVKRLEAKVSRVDILTRLQQGARLLSQNIVSQGQLEELSANTKRIELTTHQATLLSLMQMVYLSLRKLGYDDLAITALAKELKRLQKDYPIIETDYATMRKQLYASPDEMPRVIEAEYEDVDELETINNVISGKPTRGRK